MAYKPNLFHYTDLISQTQFHEKFDDLRQPVSSLSNVDDNVTLSYVDDNVTVSSKFSEPELQEESKEKHLLSKSDLDDKTAQPQENEKPLISADSESQDDFNGRNGKPMPSNEGKVVLASSKSDLDGSKSGGISEYIGDKEKSEGSFAERTGEPVSSNEEVTVPNSSNSNLDDKTKGKSEYPDDKEKSQDNFEERNDEFMSSNEEITLPIPSKSDLGDKIGEKPEHIDLEEKFSEEAASSDTESGGVIDNAIVEKLRNCDIFKGTWVKDEGYPLYKPGSCPYVDDAFDCLSNGRPDSGYTQWRWKPDDCDLPRFNATDFLVRLRGKRLMLVGDSMNRNQFESLLCLLREGLTDKSTMYEIHFQN